MDTMSRYTLTHVTDAELLAGLERLVARSNQVTAELLAHIAEVDARRLYLPAACSSMFSYCLRVLRLSEDATAKRIQAARAARQYPLIFDLIASGKLHLAAVTLLAPHLTRDNHRDLLAAAVGRSKREVEHLVATRFPAPDVPALVRKLPSPAPASASPPPTASTLPLWPATPGAPAPTATPAAAASPPTTPLWAAPEYAPGQVGPGSVGPASGVPAPGGPTPGGRGPVASARAASRPPLRPTIIAPLAPARYKVQFTAAQGLHDKLRAVQNLLGHAVPSGDLAQVFERALDALLRDLRRRKFGATDRPRARVGMTRPPRRPRPRAIPAAVRREVAARDGEQCTFVDPATGRRCESRADLHFHHLDPYARGGEHDPVRVTLRCAAHDLYAARLDYGVDFIARKIAGAR
jgi:hypothetical protein